MRKSESLYQVAWKRLKQNKVAMVGMWLIFLLVFIAILGPTIRPVKTTHADEQILQLKSQSPGFNIDLLYKAKNVETEETGWFEGLLYGFENPYSQAIPIVDYWFEDDQLVYVRFMGSMSLIDTARESVLDIAYALNETPPVIKNSIKFNTISGEVTTTLKEVQEKIETDHISNRTYWLGTDRNGRDFLSRLMAGTRVSLGVGVIAVLISVLLGVVLGAIAGYFGGWVDNIITWVISVFWSIPALLLVIAITLSLGKGIEVVFIAVGLTMWVEVARIVRGQFLSLSQFEFVEAGKALGYNKTRIIFRHILPNTVGPIIVVSVSNFATAILLEAGLSFLGLGAQPPQASWGEMVGTYSGYLVGDNPHLAIVPGTAIVLTVIAFFILGNGLRDAFDVRDLKKD